MSTKAIQYEAAKMMRDSAQSDLWDVMPDLRPEAVKFSISPDDLSVVASIQGNLEPYSQDDVAYCLGALDVKLAGVEVNQ